MNGSTDLVLCHRIYNSKRKYIEKYPGPIKTTFSSIIVVLWKKLQITTTVIEIRRLQTMGYSNCIIVFLLFVNIK